MRPIMASMTKFVLAGFGLVLLLQFTTVFARSGCCSHHGGVCGCGCCDGTGLSATCAPYYPECRSTPASTYKTADTGFARITSYLFFS